MRSPRYVLVALLLPGLLAALLATSATTRQTPNSSGGPAPADISPATIPGPLSSFLRMAAVSQKVAPDQVLPLVARNAYVLGWERESQPTEYLLLVRRYLHQARELVGLAGDKGVIEVTSCNEAKPLLAVLGYRLREGCGKDAALETSVPDRAFVTLDSGFPLAALEDALRTGRPFSYPYPSTQVPLLFTTNDWTSLRRGENQRQAGDEVQGLLEDRAVARLYWAMSRMDSETRDLLRRSPGLQKLIPVAGVLDFFGSYISVRS